jgi:hypothetical protein
MEQGGSKAQVVTAFSRAVRLVTALAAAASLAACASMSEKLAGTASDLPGIGLPAGAPERPAEQRAYPAVHDMPPPRASTVLTEVEQQKMEDDLVAARDAQRPAQAAAPTAQKKPARQSPRVIPVASSRTIY